MRIGIVIELIPGGQGRRSDRVHLRDVRHFSGQAFLCRVESRLQSRIGSRRRTGRTETEDERHPRMTHEGSESAAEVVHKSLEIARVPSFAVKGCSEASIPLALAANRKDIKQAGLREGWLLVDDAAVTLGDQQTLNVADLLARAVVNLDDDLLNSRPVVVVDTSQDVELAFFRVDLE